MDKWQLGIIGFSSGFIVAGGVVALMTGLGIITRFIGISHTASRIRYYENCILLGGVAGTLVTTFGVSMLEGGMSGTAGIWLPEAASGWLSVSTGAPDTSCLSASSGLSGASGLSAAAGLPGSVSWLASAAGIGLLAVAGLFMGVFVGGWIMALAEVINVFPVYCRRLGITKGLGLIVIAIALGKTLGSLLIFWKGWGKG